MNDFCRHACAEAFSNHRPYVDRKMTRCEVKCIGESDSAGNWKFPKPFLTTPLCRQKMTARGVRNLNSDVVNVSAGDAIAEASPKRPYVDRKIKRGKELNLCNCERFLQARMCRSLSEQCTI